MITKLKGTILTSPVKRETLIKRFKGSVVKKHGFSTFLRGCNPAPLCVGTTKSVHFQAAKLKQFLQSRK